MDHEKDNSADPVELLRLAKNGDRAAFGQIYALYFTPVFRYILARVREKDTAHDLSQTVFLKVYETVGRLEERDSSPLAYFFTVARHSVIDYWRKKKDLLIGAEDDVFVNIPDDAKNPYELAEHTDLSARIKSALRNLSDDQQEIISLRFFGGMSGREIAGVVGKNEEAVRQAQCRALKILRQHLAEYGK